MVNSLRIQEDSDDTSSNTALLFLQSLRIAASEPAEQEAIAGGLGAGVAWEVRNDLLSFGAELLSAPLSKLTSEEALAVSTCMESFRRVPEVVFRDSGSGPGISLLHEAWDAQRRCARVTLLQLACMVSRIYREFELDLDWYHTLVVSLDEPPKPA